VHISNIRYRFTDKLGICAAMDLCGQHGDRLSWQAAAASQRRCSAWRPASALRRVPGCAVGCARDLQQLRALYPSRGTAVHSTSSRSAIIQAIGNAPADIDHACSATAAVHRLGTTADAGSTNVRSANGSSLANDQDFRDGRTAFMLQGEIGSGAREITRLAAELSLPSRSDYVLPRQINQPLRPLVRAPFSSCREDVPRRPPLRQLHRRFGSPRFGVPRTA